MAAPGGHDIGLPQGQGKHMRVTQVRGGFLRVMDRMLHAGAHPATPDVHAVDQLPPFLEVLRRLRRLGHHDGSALAIRQRFHADMADFRPSTPANGAPLTVFFHGGGFIMGDLDTHDDACRVLCRASGVPLLSVAYRLAPEAPFPAAVDDAMDSARWALMQLDGWGANGLALGGDSAGANLAAVTAGTAPALIVTGGYDMLKDEGDAYGRHLLRAHVPVRRLHFPRLGHAFINLSSVHRESREAVTQVARQWRELALSSPRN
jgi:acetyl esterase/lipase